MSPPNTTPGTARISARLWRRISAIWIIPVLAVAIGGWLAWNTLSKQGPMITIAFDSGEGLQAGQSQLKFKDMVFGTVQSLDLAPDHSHVRVSVRTTSKARDLLTDATVFWVVKPRLFAGNLSGLDTLLSGAYIGMMPGPATGAARRDFIGSEQPPVLQTDVPGRKFLLRADQIGSISLGSPVFFRDLDVGEVLGWNIDNVAESVIIHAFVRAPFDRYVTDQSRFWNASGVSVKLGAAGVDLQVESLRAVLLGGIAFDASGAPNKGQPSGENHAFPLFANREAAKNASYSRKIPLVAHFPGSVGGLTVGSDVTVHGRVVGHVTQVDLRFEPGLEAIVAPVQFEVEPERILGLGAKRVYSSFDEAINALVSRGLRVSVQTSSLLTGQQSLALDFVKNPPPAIVTVEAGHFVIPTTDSGSFASLEASANDLLTKVNAIPFGKIGERLDGILASVEEMANGPQVRQTLTELASTVASMQGIARRVDGGLSPALKRLPEMTADLQKTLANTNKLIVSLNDGYGDTTKFNHDLQRSVVQLNEALSSIRALADLLSRNPEALVRGRPAGGTE